MRPKDQNYGPKDVLLSIKPPYANLIVDGVKTVELRRKFPKNLPVGTKIYVYSTSPEQIVIGECEIKEILRKPIAQLWAATSIETMISKQDFDSYFQGLEEGYGIRVWKYKRYKTPKTLQAHFGKKVSAPQSYRYLPTAEL